MINCLQFDGEKIWSDAAGRYLPKDYHAHAKCQKEKEKCNGGDEKRCARCGFNATVHEERVNALKRSGKAPAAGTPGYHMRVARMAAGLTVQQLADKSGHSAGTISGMENNTRTPNLLTVIHLADVLGLSIDDYIGREVPKRK